MNSNNSEYSYTLSCRQEETIKAGDVLFSSCKWMETLIPESWTFFFQFEYLYSQNLMNKIFSLVLLLG